ncbi:MAG TPA: imidazole glycerol phosphate synthase subunit HisH [Steroidobacteraceae bacterium]|jgi:glutamine amidotransferase
MKPTRGKPTVGIVDYQAGNIQSIENALAHLGARTMRVRAASDIGSCTHLLLPGVGAFQFCAEQLRNSGLLETVHEWALVAGKPLLGICVGMQLLAESSEEHGLQRGLNWVGGQVVQLPGSFAGVRVPHVGWNTVEFHAGFGEFASGATGDFYFDHSYAYRAPVDAPALATCRHGVEFAAVVRRDNITAAQFHPEKSQGAGMRFLRSFLAA